MLKQIQHDNVGHQRTVTLTRESVILNLVLNLFQY